MRFVTYCQFCETKVTACTLLAGNELKLALDSNEDIEVGHPVTNAGDHRWNLINEEKQVLRNKIASGELSVRP
jgi:hypothetical protein